MKAMPLTADRFEDSEVPVSCERLPEKSIALDTVAPAAGTVRVTSRVPADLPAFVRAVINPVCVLRRPARS